MVDSDSFRQPVVRNGGAVCRPAAPPRRTPFREVESLVARASPSAMKDASSIGDSNRNTKSGFVVTSFHGTRSHDRGCRSPNRCLPTLGGFLSVRRELFGLGLQADSSTDERCSLRRHEPSSAGLQAKAFGHKKMALESTLPPHNDGGARRASEKIESCFRAQGGFL